MLNAINPAMDGNRNIVHTPVALTKANRPVANVKVNEELNDIPIYIIYCENLNKVNEMINYVNDELSDFFYNLCIFFNWVNTYLFFVSTFSFKFNCSIY